MNQNPRLDYGKSYHIYNRGINSCDLFCKNANFEHFLNLYDSHISPIAETYAWALMKNHFHLLVRIKEQVEISNPQGSPNLEGLKPIKPYQSFSNLFNAYTKAFNKRNKRTGSLFEHPFKRKLVDDIGYFKTLVLYIHNNPVHHRVTTHAMDYPWSSYLSYLSIRPNNLSRNAVMGWFDNEANFVTEHNDPLSDSIDDLEKWLGI